MPDFYYNRFFEDDNMESESQFVPTSTSSQEQRLPNTTMTIDMTSAGWYNGIPATVCIFPAASCLSSKLTY
jgi:hypothetical protein